MCLFVQGYAFVYVGIRGYARSFSRVFAAMPEAGGGSDGVSPTEILREKHRCLPIEVYEPSSLVFARKA